MGHREQMKEKKHDGEKKIQDIINSAAQHPQCLFKSSEPHYSQKLGREPRLQGQGQPLQLGKALTDHLYNNSIFLN